jgi:hypothetical protein
MSLLPKAPQFVRPPLGPTLVTAGAPLDQPEPPYATVTSGTSSIEAEIAAKVALLTQQRGMRRADAIEAMLRAKAHDGRMSEPVSSHDADIAWAVAGLLHAVAGQPEAGHASPARGMNAVSGAPSVRVVDHRVEAGIAAAAERREESDERQEADTP